MEKIIIRNAHENNLKHLNLEIPLNAFTCVTGCSGCGKSSLVFDTIYAESQRGFLEGITGNIQGQKLMNKPKVDTIDNLRPALNISQNYYNVNPRSTVGTITEISYYLRTLFALVNSNQKEEISENLFSANNPKSFCPHCLGLGVEMDVSEALLIPDKEKTLKDGAILFFKGPPESKERRYLEALCEHYGIDITKKVSQLTQSDLDLLLYADEPIRYKLSYKEGRRRKQHYVTLQGAVSAIRKRIADENEPGTSSVFSRFMEEVPCHICHGAKLRKEILVYKVGGLDYSQVEGMELAALYLWLQSLHDDRITPDKENLFCQLRNSMLRKLDALLRLNVGYLCLNRAIPTLSGGERQRVRIATQLTCSLKGLIYILDEPCKGLHYRDTAKIVQATQDLVKRGNTVIAIEHNEQYIAASDYRIELGPVGGPEGGYLMEKASVFSTRWEPQAKMLRPNNGIYFELNDINLHNIHRQNVRFPIGGITCITGVSGSGKSTLAEVVARCFNGQGNSCCGIFHGSNTIKRVIRVNQAPIGKTPRSTVVSYLEIYDEIRNLLSHTDLAKKLKLDASMFSMNIKGGRCECCQGTGLQKIELNYLPSSYITCPECGGKRFKEKVLLVRYHGRTIQEILETPICDLIETFQGTKKVYPVLSSMIELGLGYLQLGQMSMNLSGGEAQRIKLAKALGASSSGHNLYILDEPTSGLGRKDIEKFIKVLFSLQANGETIILIEHDIRFIEAIADYIVDFGIQGGEAGGKIVVQGLPETVFANSKSSLFGLGDGYDTLHS